MNLIKALLNAITNLSAKKDDEVSKKDIIDTTDVDYDFPADMLEEISNGKGDDE